MRKTIAPGVWSWSRWQPDRGLDFNGFFVETAEGNLVVDPVEPDDETLAELRERGVAAVLVTNRDHERFTKIVAGATGAQVIASALDAPLLQHPVDRTVAPGEIVFGWTVVGLDGFKTPGEIALYAQARRTAIACVFGNAHDVIGAMLDVREGAFVNRINLFDEVPYAKDDGPAPFTGNWADAGRLIGAEKLGYGAIRLARGEAVCPYHWHTREEELFVVMRGTPALRTPRGTFVLRPGDCVAFATDASGAHKLWNDADEEALVLMIANTDPGDACFYPDSRKFVVEATGTLVRDNPQLDYFDGET
jgi:uncharacterized cupin superfamily protein